MSDSTRAQSRRQLLTAAAGGVAALAAEALTRPHAVDAVSAALMTEVDNPTSAETSVTSSQSTTGEVAFKVAIGDLGTALHADSPNGVGVLGTNNLGGAGVMGNSTGGAVGVIGQTGDPAGYPGVPAGSAGVYGFSSTDGPGVFGDGGVLGAGPIAVMGVGQIGSVGLGDGLGPPGQFGAGVYGYSGSVTAPLPPNNVGVYARGDGTALALQVQGKAKFSRSGRTYVAAGHANRAVTYAGVTTSSLVIATLATYRAGVYIAAVVPGSGKFTVYLNKAVTASTYFVYMILN
ncbi:MAG: hypothetical protein E6I45_11920 [Chloroflexi bacterium]|nr:MAG: hypothetical protein E6I45_11920 [Chloroflexota bacterium]